MENKVCEVYEFNSRDLHADSYQLPDTLVEAMEVEVYDDGWIYLTYTDDGETMCLTLKELESIVAYARAWFGVKSKYLSNTEVPF